MRVGILIWQNLNLYRMKILYEIKIWAHWVCMDMKKNFNLYENSRRWNGMRWDEICGCEWGRSNGDGIFIFNLYRDKAGIRQKFNVRLRFEFDEFV